MGVVSVLWALVGYSLAFGPSALGGWIGDASLSALPISDNVRAGTLVPELLFMVYEVRPGPRGNDLAPRCCALILSFVLLRPHPRIYLDDVRSHHACGDLWRYCGEAQSVSQGGRGGSGWESREGVRTSAPLRSAALSLTPSRSLARMVCRIFGAVDYPRLLPPRALGLGFRCVAS